MKQANLINLQLADEAQRLDLACTVIQGLGGWILRVERTEEEIARGSIAFLRELIDQRNLRLTF
jgi:hypothetical protein